MTTKKITKMAEQYDIKLDTAEGQTMQPNQIGQSNQTGQIDEFIVESYESVPILSIVIIALAIILILAVTFFGFTISATATLTFLAISVALVSAEKYGYINFKIF